MKSLMVFGLLVLAVFFSGCAGGSIAIRRETRQTAEQNRSNIILLKIGMPKDKVVAVMGKPYTTESYQINGKSLEFWLYITEPTTIEDVRIRDSNLTPLAFENSVLAGWGRNYYDQVIHLKKDITIESR